MLLESTVGEPRSNDELQEHYNSKLLNLLGEQDKDKMETCINMTQGIKPLVRLTGELIGR